jgi:hypothetical protein
MSGGGGRRQYTDESEVTGWVGWIVFAGTMMTLIGVFHMFGGIISLVRRNTVVFPTGDLVVSVNYTQYGWMQLIGGAIVFLAGLGLFTGRTWARVVGVAIALISAIFNFVFLTAFPIWSITLIAIDIFVIYALTAHGGEMKVAREAE